MPSASSPSVLVVDDDPGVLALIRRLAESMDYVVESAASGEIARDKLSRLHPDCAIVDVHLGDVSGVTLLSEIHAFDPQVQVILMTGQADLEAAVAAIKAGALDYLAKPFDSQRLRELLTTVKKGAERRETLLRIDSDVARQFEFYGLIGRNPAMQELFDAVRRFAPYARSVLVTGETGTGKELVARALHRLGPRRDKRLVTVNCSAIVESLFESELFGHMRGAFTGATDNKVGLLEHAHGGTIFLDEIGELSLPLQAKILRAVENGDVQRVGALESRKTDVFAIAATNRDLRAESEAGRFRSDLYFRLSTIELLIPPLRERPDDISYLAAAFIGEFSKRLKRPITGMTSSAERRLRAEPWLGNVRELRNTLERACIRGNTRLLTGDDIAAALSPRRAPIEASGGTGDIATASLASAEHQHIESAMRAAGGNKAAAAKQLGISRRSLYRRLERIRTSKPAHS